MGYRALVVDDSFQILATVSAILDSLGHEYDLADCQEAARDLLARNQYSYFLLDLEIPVHPGDVNPRIQNGKNLMAEIQKWCRGKVPVIVMTSHGADTPDLAIEMMKLGAVDYVTKPFRAEGNTLDKAILDALHGLSRPPWGPLDHVGPANGRPRRHCTPFTGGELVFYKTHVQLCGVTIITDAGFGQSMKLLEGLRDKDRAGRFLSRRGEDLVAAIEADNGINTVTSCVSHLRRNITARLLEHKGVRCGLYDVIDHNEQGYFLRGWIVVRTAADGCVQRDRPNPLPETGLNERQKWILKQLGEGVHLDRRMLQKQFSISEKTAKRDLRELVEQGAIGFVRSPRPGHYRLPSSAGLVTPGSCCGWETA